MTGSVKGADVETGAAAATNGGGLWTGCAAAAAAFTSLPSIICHTPAGEGEAAGAAFPGTNFPSFHVSAEGILCSELAAAHYVKDFVESRVEVVVRSPK